MEKAWQDVLDKFHYGIYLITSHPKRDIMG